MGCCFSRSSGPNAPYPGGAPDASSRAINPPSPPLAMAVPEGAQGSQSPRRRQRDQRPLDQHIDKPLRRHQWTSKDRAWTKTELARERADFFDTRVTGRPEVWQTVHAALQVLWDPESQGAPDDGSNGLATAQMIITAADISLPTGNLANGVYDALGNYYQIPEWVVCDPQNVVVVDDDGDGEHATKGDVSTADGDTTAEEDNLTDGDEDEDETEAKPQEKGKEAVDAREKIALRARLSENGKDVKVTFVESDTVKHVSKKIAEQAGLAKDKKVRIAYMGKLLKENSSLAAQDWQTGHIVNAFVFDS